jgi:hypothetical protein
MKMGKTNHQEAIGLRLEDMYHTAVSIHELTSQFIANCPRSYGNVSFIWAVQEMAAGQARELEALAEHFGGSKLGYYANHFEAADAALITTKIAQGEPA